MNAAATSVSQVPLAPPFGVPTRVHDRPSQCTTYGSIWWPLVRLGAYPTAHTSSKARAVTPDSTL
ncbi:hypothetical protein [Nonomuraea jabiensis]|uniref:Uncharacterized protein n=1 Tax=Nonomuraea jabiensis TaxID=882448 RepID=A0A7W9G2M4_9ACTN|nr:hypothetical protein [Nonomuraea jabiensis]MBB5775987.1 hypothetical protein [Nonomuraea jabiensis]